MQHLNIPLSRNSKTTRRTRWVVWILAAGIFSIMLATAWISTLWFTRDTIYKAAPENTTIAVRFFISGKKGEIVESITKNIPLISNRSLTLTDLSPYISGEFVLFVNKDGSRSIAIRKGKTALPQSLLDSQTVAVQPIGHNIVLLSEKQVIIKPFQIKPKLLPGISLPGKRWIGELVDQTNTKRSFLFATKNHVEMTLPVVHTDGQAFKQIPNDTFAYLSTPFLPNTSNEFLDPFLPLMQSVVDPQFLAHLNDLANNKSQLLLTKDANGVGFFLTITPSELKKDIDIEQALRSIAALNTPKIQETLLDDGSSIKEIIANPNSVSVEQITLLGTQINRIHVNNVDLLASRAQNHKIFLTNRESLFRYTKESAKSANKICSGNMAGIALQPLVTMQNQYANVPNNSAILLFAQNFSSIGVKSGIVSTTIRFCK
ncbi:hypothetical protein A2839_04360 [Candidatus Uhrbacteria bacterium RIFCSPHIGHO2_01_FULL_47_10]|nr:MAG: hypothetical protein A2839_04360 [Candidatus Uhrbacteria bacterium RIFCSPHIGHO2_01_FULL_47_10]